MLYIDLYVLDCMISPRGLAEGAEVAVQGVQRVALHRHVAQDQAVALALPHTYVYIFIIIKGLI